MLPWIVIGGIALFGFFALKDQTATQTSGTGGTGSAGGFPPSGDHAVDVELSSATSALVASYNALGGCIGLNQANVARFQRAINAYAGALGTPDPLTADGIFDLPTYEELHSITGLDFSSCMLTFEQAPAVAQQQPAIYGSPGALPPGTPAPAPGTPQTAGPTPDPALAQAPQPSTFDSWSATPPSAISPTAGRLSWAGRT